MPTLTLLADNALNWASGASIAWAPSLPAAAERGLAPVPARSRRQEPEFSDAVWIARAREGDEEAARTLIERLYPTVIKSVRRHLPQRTGEEDLTQAVFAKIFKSLHQFSGRVPLEHWVSRIAVNTCLNQLKHESGRPELRMSDLSEEQEAVVQHLACTSTDLPGDQSCAARELLEKLLAPLSSDDRLVITLLH